MPLVQGEEHDYVDNPDEGYPKIVPENLPNDQSTSTGGAHSFLFSYFQPQQQEQAPPAQPPPEVAPVFNPNSSSSNNFYNRIATSSRTMEALTFDELNDTRRLVRGKGILASKKDVMVSPSGV